MRILLLAWWLCLGGPAMAQPAVAACAAAHHQGLCHEAVVAAPTAEVWRLLSTSDGLQSWASPLAAIDLRIDGIWESSYAPGAQLGDPANIQNRVLSFLPEHMLSIAIARAPPDFAHAEEARRLWTVIELEPVDEAHTRIRITMLGFGEGEGFAALRDFFDRGNAFTLARLAEQAGAQ